MNNVQLASRLENLIAFAQGEQPQKKETHYIRNGLIGLGGAAAAYAGGSYLRGRGIAKSRDFGPATGWKEHLGLLKLGHDANVGTLSRLPTRAKGLLNRAGRKVDAARAAVAGAIEPKRPYANPY